MRHLQIQGWQYLYVVAFFVGVLLLITGISKHDTTKIWFGLLMMALVFVRFMFFD
jgi:hypothetical protein